MWEEYIICCPAASFVLSLSVNDFLASMSGLWGPTPCAQQMNLKNYTEISGVPQVSADPLEGVCPAMVAILVVLESRFNESILNGIAPGALQRNGCLRICIPVNLSMRLCRLVLCA